MPARLVILASGAGTTLQAIIDTPDLGRQIVAVGADRPGVPALDRAHAAGIETFVVPFTDYPDRASWNRAFSDTLDKYSPDLVVLAGFMRIFDEAVVHRFRIVNTHPALLPSFPGAHPIRDALAAGVRVTGVTVHWVDEGIDTGPIVAQVAVPVEHGDDEQTLRARVQAAEKPLYVATIRRICKEILGV
jgi:formyltetrahydrofolate-dependent phosphoribosylglycinamide formyltransferase